MPKNDLNSLYRKAAKGSGFTKTELGSESATGKYFLAKLRHHKLIGEQISFLAPLFFYYSVKIFV
ncbi:hypothetical protein SAMN04488023_13712 [Pedobacter rhizosphaerae]|uniref:Uncharacterized protein n=1 Tax=Pedobacter rhizosphaerae TaxID=390241 RepID=A0A1H9V2W6_9SPHI|nr:hypothetical protein SAMN04488023_13712 [Pedobacter rhizosphaerae]